MRYWLLKIIELFDTINGSNRNRTTKKNGGNKK